MIIDLDRIDFENRMPAGYKNGDFIQQVSDFLSNHINNPTRIIGCGSASLNILKNLGDINADKIVFNERPEKVPDDVVCINLNLMSSPLPDGVGIEYEWDLYSSAEDELLKPIIHMADKIVFVGALGGSGWNYAANFADWLIKSGMGGSENLYAILQKPAFFEGEKRNSRAEQHLCDIRKSIKNIFVFESNELLELDKGKEHAIKDFYRICDSYIAQKIRDFLVEHIDIFNGKQ